MDEAGLMDEMDTDKFTRRVMSTLSIGSTLPLDYDAQTAVSGIMVVFH